MTKTKDLVRLDTRAQQSEQAANWLAAIVSSTTDAIIGMAMNGVVTSFNPAAERLFGYSSEEIIGKPVNILIPADRQEEEDRILAQIAAGECVEHYDAIRLHKHGNPIDVSVCVSAVLDANGRIIGAAKIAREITGRKQAEHAVGKSVERYHGAGDDTELRRAEEALRKSEERLRLAMEASGTGLWEWDLATDAVIWSPECYTIHGLKQGEFDGTAAAFDSSVHGDDRERVWASIRSAAERGHRYDAEFRIVRPSGEVRWVTNLGRAVYDREGRPIRMIGTITDVTGRKQTAEAFRESEQRLRLSLDAAKAGIWEAIPSNGEFIASDRALALHGLPPGTEMTHEKALAAVHPDDRQSVEAALRHTIETGAPFRMELRALWPDGSVRWLESRAELKTSEFPPKLVGL